MRIVDQVCQALAYAHEKTVHRDIKPENVWLTDDGKAKVMDFGIALLTNSTHVLETMMSAGTPYYMAPEQLAGLGGVDGRADQYAVAVMLYEMLSGQVPTGRIESLKKVRKDVPSAVSNAVNKALSQKAASRYATIKEFRDALFASRLSASFRNFKLLGAIVGGVALLGAAIGTFPMWSGILPDRGSDAAAKQEAARLQGEVKSLLKLVDTQRREVKDALVTANRDAERVEGPIRSARSAEERTTLQTTLLETREKIALATAVDQRLREQLEGASGLPAIEGGISAAETALKTGNAPEANSEFTAALRALNQARAVPEEVKKQLLDARNKILSQLDGKWSMSGCDSASTFTVKDSMLLQYWPSMGLAEEKIVQVGAETITTVVVAPASQRGKLFRYTPAGARLDVEDVAGTVANHSRSADDRATPMCPMAMAVAVTVTIRRCRESASDRASAQRRRR